MNKSKARKILQNHYADILNGRKLTDEEVDLEIANLLRKYEKGNLDDSQHFLYCRLGFN